MNFLFVDDDLVSTDTDEILDMIDEFDVAVVKKNHLDLVKSIERLSKKLSRKNQPNQKTTFTGESLKRAYI